MSDEQVLLQSTIAQTEEGVLVASEPVAVKAEKAPKVDHRIGETFAQRTHIRSEYSQCDTTIKALQLGINKMQELRKILIEYKGKLNTYGWAAYSEIQLDLKACLDTSNDYVEAVNGVTVETNRQRCKKFAQVDPYADSDSEDDSDDSDHDSQMD